MAEAGRKSVSPASGRGLDKGYGLDSGHFEAFAAADVFAADQVVAAHHVALGLGEAGAVPVICAASELGFFAADEPSEFVFSLLSAVGAGHGVNTGLRPFIKKIALFH